MKKIIITGGCSGIGKYMAQQFALKGHLVFVFDVKDNELKMNNIHYYKVDLTDEKAIKAAFSDLECRFGKPDVLINNGAISKFHKSIYELTTLEFDRVINTNLRGTFLCVKEFIKLNKNTDYARIINIASTRYHQNEAGWEAYGASKGGIVSLTNSLCVSLANTNITVNVISPGWIQVENYANLTKADHTQHPSGRVGKPKDIFNVCEFLIAEENDFINGANIIVDGGMTKRMIYEETFNFEEDQH